MKRRHLLVACFALIQTFSFFGCDRHQGKGSGSAEAEITAAQVIRVGEVTTLTGTEGTFGQSGHRGISLAVEEANEAGGIGGKRIELITLDDRGSPEEATVAATQLITKHKVVALTGALPSSRGIAIAPIAQKYKIPMVSSASTHPEVTRFGNYIYRVCFTDPFQGQVMAKFALEHLKVKKVAILRDVKSDYSVGLASFFTYTFKKGGGQIVLEQTYGTGDIDYKAQLTAIRAKEPDAIFIPGYYTEGALIARQVKELGLKMPLLGGDGWDSPKFIEIGEDATEGAYYSTHYSSDSQSEQVQTFVSKYRKNYKTTPDGIGTLAYDGMRLLIEAIRRAKEISPEGIVSSIGEIGAEPQGFSGVTGKIKFDEKRNPLKTAVVMKINDGKPSYITDVEP